MADDDTSTRAAAASRGSITDFSGTRIGSVGVGGAAVDQAGTRIGTIHSDGSVVDFSGVRIGHLVQHA